MIEIRWHQMQFWINFLKIIFIEKEKEEKIPLKTLKEGRECC
jgi:hypothetical protein